MLVASENSDLLEYAYDSVALPPTSADFSPGRGCGGLEPGTRSLSGGEKLIAASAAPTSSVLYNLLTDADSSSLWSRLSSQFCS